MTIPESSEKQALLVEYQKLTPTGTPTGIEASIIAKLTSRGFPVLSYGTQEGFAPDNAYLTLLLDTCDEGRLENAISQIENIIGIIRASKRSLALVTQELHARVEGLSGDEMRTLRKELGVNLHRTAIFPAIPERTTRSKTRALNTHGAKITKAKRERIDEEKEPHQRQVNLKVRIQNPSAAVSSLVSELGGAFRELDILHLNADVPHIDRAAEYLRTEIAPKVSEMYITAPRTNIAPRHS